MTYDELLTKIEDDFDYDSVNSQYKNALRAIAELPMEGDIEGVILRQSFADNTPRELATYAYKMGYEVAMNKVIQTIEKELM